MKYDETTAIPVATVALWGFSSLTASARGHLQRRPF